MLSLLKSVLKSCSQKNKNTHDDIQDLPNKFDSIPNKSESNFVSLWQAAEREDKDGNVEDARHLLYKALESDPSNVELLYQIGKLERKMKYYEDASDNLLTAIHIDPNTTRVYLELGMVSINKEQLDDALNYFELAHKLEPNNPAGLCGIGNVYLKKTDFDNAVSAYQQAIEVDPEYGISYSNLGNCYSKMQRYDQALTPLLIANALNPFHIEALVNLNFVYYSQGKFGEAYQAVRKALALAPDDEDLHWILSWSLLLFKRFDTGWQEYEYRFSSAGKVERRDFPFPIWQGENLNDKNIFVAAEQGMGDQIMFASCLQDLVGQAEHCILECDKKLVGLFQYSFTDIQVIGTQQKPETETIEFLPPKIDFYTRIGSLPLRFRKNAVSFSPARAYLKAEETRIEYWLQQLVKLGDGIKIGISWRGGVEKTRNFLRTIPLRDWGAILCLPNIHFVNLQYGDCEQDLQEARNLFDADIQHWPEAIKDYQETAALVSALDLVVSVCTSVIHLSGALGQHTWVLVPSSPEWRYLAKDETLPWYQNVKLYRQQQLWEWQPVIERVAMALTELQSTQNSNK